MREYHVILGLLLCSLMGCSASIFEDERSKQEIKSPKSAADASDATKEDADQQDFSANEPVPIGGGFLICAHRDNLGKSIGCRIEDQEYRKMELQNLRNDDLIALSSDRQAIKISFQVTESDSFWHWLTTEDISELDIASIRLSDRFLAEGGDSAKESDVLDLHPNDILIPDPVLSDEVAAVRLQVVGPPPAEEVIEFISDTQVKAGEYFWYYGRPNQSCSEVCENRGGNLETVTAAWTSSMRFCGSLHRKMLPDLPIDGLGILFDQIGLGCFTNILTGSTIYQEVNLPPAMANAKGFGVRRFCACRE
ncbi:MAG: hypothetical protein ACOH5I_07700 [Oligoflexus sp.]